MRSLKQYNDDFREAQRMHDNTRHLAKVVCDKCNTELHLTEPGVLLMSYPPKQRVHCPNDDCDFTGYKVGSG